jgi:magnesium transporter
VNAEQLDTVFLINRDAKLAGAVAVGRLLLAGESLPLAALKMEPVVSVAPEADDKEVFELFDKYGLRSLAVVDAESRPVGAITVDDVVERLRSRA